MNRSNDDVVILSGVRTAIGKFQGALSNVPAPQLGGVAIRAALERANVPGDRVDEVIMGNVVQAGEGQAPARQAAINGGLPVTVGALTVNKVCGSGLKAVMLASNAIRSGDGEIFVCGGMENMDLAPYMLPRLARATGWATARSWTQSCTMGSGARSRGTTWGIRLNGWRTNATSVASTRTSSQCKAIKGPSLPWTAACSQTRSFRSLCRSERARRSCSLSTRTRAATPPRRSWRR